jgi:hypothetical protein
MSKHEVADDTMKDTEIALNFCLTNVIYLNIIPMAVLELLNLHCIFNRCILINTVIIS